jgi:hypothetical protein
LPTVCAEPPRDRAFRVEGPPDFSRLREREREQLS